MSQPQCETDRDCTEKFFCDLVLGYCEPCSKLCLEDPLECSRECPGFLTTTTSTQAVASPTSAIPNSTTYSSGLSSQRILLRSGLTVLILVLLLLISILAMCCWRKRKQSLCNCCCIKYKKMDDGVKQLSNMQDIEVQCDHCSSFISHDDSHPENLTSMSNQSARTESISLMQGGASNAHPIGHNEDQSLDLCSFTRSDHSRDLKYPLSVSLTVSVQETDFGSEKPSMLCVSNQHSATGASETSFNTGTHPTATRSVQPTVSTAIKQRVPSHIAISPIQESLQLSSDQHTGTNFPLQPSSHRNNPQEEQTSCLFNSSKRSKHSTGQASDGGFVEGSFISPQRSRASDRNSSQVTDMKGAESVHKWKEPVENTGDLTTRDSKPVQVEERTPKSFLSGGDSMSNSLAQELRNDSNQKIDRRKAGPIGSREGLISYSNEEKAGPLESGEGSWMKNPHQSGRKSGEESLKMPVQVTESADFNQGMIELEKPDGENQPAVLELQVFDTQQDGGDDSDTQVKEVQGLSQPRQEETPFIPGIRNFNPNIRPNRRIYQLLRRIHWVQGYFSEGSQIEVYVDYNDMSPEFAIQELVRITKEKPSKFKISPSSAA